MNPGILTLPVLPIRSEPSERAEMTTQLLYGERYDVLEVQDNWSLIRNLADGYEGWATSKMLTPISDQLEDEMHALETRVLPNPLVSFRGIDIGQMFLPAGSRLFVHGNHFYFPVAETMVELFPEKEGQFVNPTYPLPERILETAFQFLNAPYLWGGKTILGMDCSGLMQVSAAIHGFQLPRDARDQAMLGEEQFLSLALPGDLAFFANSEGRIVHVGLICGPRQILHASGKVRVDVLDEQGIFNTETKQYTHLLHSIKRIFGS